MPKMKTHSGAKKRFKRDRQRQAHAPADQPPPPARAQAVDADPAPGHDVELSPGRRQEGQAAARPLASQSLALVVP